MIELAHRLAQPVLIEDLNKRLVSNELHVLCGI
jgi:hypothetical protein